MGAINCKLVSLEKGKYYNEVPPPLTTYRGINQFTYSVLLQNGCVIHGTYKVADLTPAYSRLEITDIDKQRKIICGKFRFRFKLEPNSGTASAYPSHTLPEIVTFENGIFATRY
jgi:hypothetical protein